MDKKVKIKQDESIIAPLKKMVHSNNKIISYQNKKYKNRIWIRIQPVFFVLYICYCNALLLVLELIPLASSCISCCCHHLLDIFGMLMTLPMQSQIHLHTCKADPVFPKVFIRLRFPSVEDSFCWYLYWNLQFPLPPDLLSPAERNAPGDVQPHLLCSLHYVWRRE